MKKEHELILKGVLLNKSQEETAYIDGILKEKLNWIEIGGILLNHRLGGYFYNGLEDEQRKCIPKEMSKALNLLIRGQKIQQQYVVEELKRVNDTLIRDNIRFAALKGAVFSCDMYNLGDRRSNDIDLLILEDDLERLDDSLRKLGYIQSNMPNGEMIEATKREKLIQRMNYHDLVPYVKKTNHGVLELDINFLFDGKENLIDSKVFEMGTEMYKGRNYDVIGLNYYTNLAHLCTHFYREATNTIWTEGRRDVTLYKIVDIMNFIRTYRNEIDQEKLVEVFSILNLSNKAHYTFKIMQEFYDDTFLDTMLKSIKIDNEEFVDYIYDTKNKQYMKRTESFYESAFSYIS